MCDRNEVWNAKCKEFKMDVSKFDVNPSELAKVASFIGHITFACEVLTNKI